MMKGTVKWFDIKKGFGFITGEDGNDVFVHFSGISQGKQFLDQGDEVEFDKAVGENGTVASGVVITKPVVRPRKKNDDKSTETEAAAETTE